ncbi:MAG: glutaredoxin family protein [Bradyrhizobium sp.]
MKMQQLRMYVRTGCEDSAAARHFLKERQIAFEEIDIDRNRGALEFVMRVNEGKQRTPTFEVGGRIFHCSPFNPAKLIRELGLQGITQPSSDLR